MHELSMAQAIVRDVSGALPGPDSQVTSVRLRVGALAGVTAEGLGAALELAAAGTPVSGSSLVLESAPVMVECPTCGRQPVAGPDDLACTSCGGREGSLVADSSVELLGFTVVERPSPSAPGDAAPLADGPTASTGGAG